MGLVCVSLFVVCWLGCSLFDCRLRVGCLLVVCCLDVFCLLFPVGWFVGCVLSCMRVACLSFCLLICFV